jgi:RNA polymerase sigma-70 factor (ECF subfamily)
MIWRFAQRLGVDAVEAEDIAQRVLLIAAERVADLQTGKERAFLLKTTIFVTRKALRVRRSRQTESIDDCQSLTDGAAGIDEQVDQRRALLLLDRMLRQLPRKLRETFVLFEIEGHSQPEIAQLLALPLGTVASRLRRGREQFLQIAAKYQVLTGSTSHE